MRLIEKEKRLSDSLLWQLQRAFYFKQGSQAWSKALVPSYATSNSYTVRQYVQLIRGYLRDCLSNNSPTSIDLSQPLYIFDLGAGSGQFAYLFLKELLATKIPVINKIRLRYVMTDILEDNLLYLVKHPYLKPYFQAGILDVAYYEHTFKDEPTHLFFSKEPVEQGLVNPIIVICNYFFDTLPQDLFRVENDRLEEGRIDLLTEEEVASTDLTSLNPNLIPNLNLQQSYHPIENLKNYYPDFSECNPVLEAYCKQLKNQSFLFPIGGLQAMHYFSWLSQNRMLVLVGDHGPCNLEQLQQSQGKEWIAKHNNFSLSVNFDSISRYFVAKQGFFLLPTNPDPFFVVGAFLLGGFKSQYSNTSFAYNEYVDSFQMRDYWKLIMHFKEKSPDPLIETIIHLLKFGNWDPLIFQLFLENIRHDILNIPNPLKETLSKAIDTIWDHYYPLSQESGIFANSLGELLFAMELYPQALTYFQQSLEITGYRPETYLNMGASYLAMKDMESAQSCYQLAKIGNENG